MKRGSKAVALALALALGACGGGGGGSAPSGSTSSPSSGPPSGYADALGLVPVAGAAGDTLAERADSLRPVLAGARWFYHEQEGGTSTDITTSAADNGSNSVIETDSNDNVPTTVTLDPANGSVSMSGTISLVDGGPAIAVAGYELRSPVRVNDQYVLLSEHIDDTQADFDGDNKQDAVDIAIYRVVVAREQVSLPAASAPLDTVRVDTIMAVRVYPSTGGATQSHSLSQSSWYAEGLGVVRMVSYGNATSNQQSAAPGHRRALQARLVPTASMGGSASTVAREDDLTGFDGLDHGWGTVTQDAQYGAGTAVGAIGASTAVSDGILAANGGQLAKLDFQGRLVSLTSWQQLGIDSNGQFVRLNGQVRWLTPEVPAPGSFTRRWKVYALNEDGTAPSNQPLSVIDVTPPAAGTQVVDGPYVTSAPNGDRFWLWWTQTALPVGEVAMVQAFDANGQPLTSPIVVAPTPTTGMTLNATATPAGLLAAWGDGGLHAYESAIDANGTVLWSSAQDGSQSYAPLALFPLADTTGSWLLWRGSSLGDTTNQPGGVRLDSQGNFVGTTNDATVFQTQMLSAVNADFYGAAWTASSGKFYLTAHGTGPLYPGDSQQTSYLVYTALSPGDAGLAAGLTTVDLVKVPGLSPLAANNPPVVLGDHVVLLADDGWNLRPVVIWPH